MQIIASYGRENYCGMSSLCTYPQDCIPETLLLTVSFRINSLHSAVRVIFVLKSNRNLLSFRLVLQYPCTAFSQPPDCAPHGTAPDMLPESYQAGQHCACNLPVHRFLRSKLRRKPPESKFGAPVEYQMPPHLSTIIFYFSEICACILFVTRRDGRSLSIVNNLLR